MADRKNFLNRDAILKAEDYKIEEVEMPEWGGTVFVRSLTGAERDQYEASMATLDKKGNVRDIHMENIRARLVALTVCDETGQRLFGDTDVKALGEKNAAALERVFQAAQRLSGLTKRDLDELADGLKNAPSAGSTSD
jgi:hypothetical protein